MWKKDVVKLLGQSPELSRSRLQKVCFLHVFRVTLRMFKIILNGTDQQVKSAFPTSQRLISRDASSTIPRMSSGSSNLNASWTSTPALDMKQDQPLRVHSVWPKDVVRLLGHYPELSFVLGMEILSLFTKLNPQSLLAKLTVT